MKLSVIPVLAALLVMSGCEGGDANFPVIGLGEKGEPQQVMVPEQEYSGRLKALVTTTNDSVLPALEKNDDEGGWNVRTFLVGIGVNGTIGVGSWKVGVNPKTRIAFTNSSNPTLP